MRWRPACVVSIGAFGWGLVYLFRLVRSLGGDEAAAASAVILACAWPCALFYSAVYTEGLFFLGVVGAWYHLRERQWVAAFAWGVITGLSRPNGFLVSVPLALLAVTDWRAVWRNEADSRRTALLGVAAAAGPGIGLLIFCAYLQSLTGNPLAWMEAHQAWGRIATDVAGLFTERADVIAKQGFYTYSISQPIELVNATFVIAALALAVPITRRFGVAYGVFLLLMVGPPLFRGGFLSLGRLTSTLFPLFLYLGWQPARDAARRGGDGVCRLPGPAGGGLLHLAAVLLRSRLRPRAGWPGRVTSGGPRPYLLTGRRTKHPRPRFGDYTFR